MATLGVNELAKCRYGSRLPYPKNVLNAASQSVEAWQNLVATKTTVSGEIDDATQPLGATLTNPEKKLLVAYVFECLYLQDKEA